MPKVPAPYADFFDLRADGVNGRALIPVHLGNSGELIGVVRPGDNAALAAFAERVEGYADQPQEADLLPFSARMLSKTLVAGIYDFAEGNVLKSSLAVLTEPLTLYRDHAMKVDLWVGQVLGYEWSGPKGGRPPGIDFSGTVDRVQAPAIHRGMQLNPPTVSRFSTTVLFDFQRSHPDLDTWQFWAMLGEEHDGEIVRLIVTEIINYSEISVVWYGADPYAEKFILGGGVENKGVPPERREETTMPTPTLEKLAAEHPAVLLELKELRDLAAKVPQLEKEQEVLAEKVLAVRAKAAVGEEYIKDQQERAKKAFALIHPDGVPEDDIHVRAVAAYAKKGEIEMLVLKVEELETAVEAKFPLHCAACSSTELTRKQTQAAPDDQPERKVPDGDSPSADVGQGLDRGKEEK